MKYIYIYIPTLKTKSIYIYITFTPLAHSICHTHRQGVFTSFISSSPDSAVACDNRETNISKKKKYSVLIDGISWDSNHKQSDSLFWVPRRLPNMAYSTRTNIN